MTVRGQGAVQRIRQTDLAPEWTTLVLGEASATYANTSQTVASSDVGAGYMRLTATGDGAAPGDYLSRMQAKAWDLPTYVGTIGQGGWDAVFRLTLANVPADGSAYTIYIGFTDGDPTSGSTIALAAGIRYAAVNPRLVATTRGGGGADVESSPITSPAEPGQVIVTIDASTVALNQAGVHCLSADGATNGDAVITRADTSTYAGPLKVIIAWGVDATGGSTAYSLDVKPEVLWRRLPL